ncbi:alpha/beta-hydrolase [Ophiobolus disseminans]|uniref:Alpha/beta-hydrolase n=1 Tax=Ophiobolus disseminans TaxID=1469910 RepID=A0A6A7ABF5_9PLEO|nr:alpha/beta-hydrolase [Ophiobolus disseminans]
MAALKPDLRVPYKDVLDVDIPTDIYLPTSPASSKACPVLIMIHGGAFMLGHAGMNNKDQIADCLDRGWIVLAIEHRLCPGVNVLEGPMTDVRDALAWVQNGGLAGALGSRETGWKGGVDEKRVMIMGTSSGGHLALSTAFNTPTPPLALLNFYAPVNFSAHFWTQPLTHMPPSFSSPRPAHEIAALHAEKTTLIGGASLEGHSSSSASAPDPQVRHLFAMHAIATGKIIPTVWPAYPVNLAAIDPILNVSKNWPPVCIVHGSADTMVPMHLSRDLERRLREEGVECEFIEVEGEEHTFCGKMERGGGTWVRQRKGWEWLEGVLERSYHG